MSKKVTEKCKYKTRYAIDTWVTAAQYIAELICESIAKKEESNLPLKFWNTDKWKNIFIYQAGIASKLLKTYHPTDIIEAIGEVKSITSLKNPIFMDLLRKKARIRRKSEQIVEIVKKDTESVPQTTTVISPPRLPQKKKSILDEL